ncbi:hypothetical protein Rsub_00747 [Raphidocelis subcapitata]|uniref:Uncharacterized protein n=1 Tax=Raphidocelis subcapitata TaxID=307507 RepID=A0A2V0NT75_9CHLO|nr:hypothetical protein Rsub_00747 [Raphidocelis subcapitata]|eukprot:GBF88035.1 hypothetical protein Rsub_00747 [Raphidocelis subcapitata]
MAARLAAAAPPAGARAAARAHRAPLQPRTGAPRPAARSGSAVRAAPQTGQPGSAQQLAVDFSGVWVKDKDASDSMEPAMDLIQLNGLVRQAVGLIRGVEVRQGGGDFEFSVLSVIPWFKITERYPLSGQPAQSRRRDLRGGSVTGRVTAPSPDTLAVALEWGEPHGGTGEDVFSMPSADCLVIDQTTRTTGGGEVRYRSIYRREG